jgi:hypothetical protein
VEYLFTNTKHNTKKKRIKRAEYNKQFLPTRAAGKDRLHFYIINKLDAQISQIYSWNENLHASDSSSVHHQEFFTVHIAMVYVIQVC